MNSIRASPAIQPHPSKKKKTVPADLVNPLPSREFLTNIIGAAISVIGQLPNVAQVDPTTWWLRPLLPLRRMSLFRLFVSRSSHHSASFGKCFFFVAVRTGVFVLQIGFLFLPSSVGHLFYHSRTPHRATLIFLLFTSPPPRSGILNATFSPYALCSPLCFLLPLLFRYLVLISFERFPLSYSLLRFSSFAHRAFPSPRVRVYTYILGYTTNTYVLTLALHAKNDVAYTALLAFFFFSLFPLN